MDLKKKTIKYYIIFRGRRPGIYSSWEKCVDSVIKFKGSLFRSFSMMEEATKAWRLFFETNRVKETGSSNEDSSNIEKQKLEMVEKEMKITKSLWMNNSVIGCIVIAFVIGMLIGKQLH